MIADTGEDAIVYRPDSDYAANMEAEPLPLLASRAAAAEPLVKASTPEKAKCEHVAEFLGIPLERTVKSIVLATDGEAGTQVWLLLIRGDHELNEIKASKVPGLADFRFATENEIVDTFGSPPGYLGPVGTLGGRSAGGGPHRRQYERFLLRRQRARLPLHGVNWGRDLPEPQVADLRNVVEGDASPGRQGRLSICRGIEVGHVFMLGTRYSVDMNANFLDENGKTQPMQMGCYGIGVTRILGAAIEQNFDERGIIWPAAIAPFEVVVCPVGYDRNEAVKAARPTASMPSCSRPAST